MWELIKYVGIAVIALTLLGEFEGALNKERGYVPKEIPSAQEMLKHCRNMDARDIQDSWCEEGRNENPDNSYYRK